MHEQRFQIWLEGCGLSSRLVSDAISRCRRVQGVLGDLDAHWGKDRLRDVLTRLEYSAEDRRSSQPNRSGIAIDGDIHNGLSSLRSAVRKYAEFRSSST